MAGRVREFIGDQGEVSQLIDRRSDEELLAMQRQFGLHDLSVEDARHGHQRPKVEEYGDSLFAVVHMIEPEGDELVVGELDTNVDPSSTYQVVDALVKVYSDLAAKGETLLGQKIASVVTVNGVRVTLEDGTWGLVRASSNKPSLVVVVESPASEANMRAMFKDIDTRLGKHPEVGEYDQKI